MKKAFIGQGTTGSVGTKKSFVGQGTTALVSARLNKVTSVGKKIQPRGKK